MKEPRSVNDMIGLLVRTSSELPEDGERGLLVSRRAIEARHPDSRGIVRGFVAGHGGDVWWVETEHGVGAYGYWEFDPEIEPRTPPE